MADEQVGQPITRKEALKICRQILKDAEDGRAEMAKREAKQGIQYEETDC